jgi:LPS export ABC transporter protein LptC
MTSWQRRVRLGLGIFVAVFSVALFFAIRKRPEPPPTKTVAREPNAIIESTRGSYDLAREGREVFRVYYDKLATYADGHTKLTGVKAAVTQKSGQVVTISAQEADVAQDRSAYDMRGDVRMATQDGLQVQAQRASYRDADGLVNAPGPVTFTKGRMSGHAVGMTYDRQQNVISLLDQVSITVAPEKTSPATQVDSSIATWSRNAKTIHFEQNVKMTRGEQVVEADEVTARLTDDEQKLHGIEMRGDSHVTGAEGGPGSLKGMRSRDMDLVYGADGETLERATLVSGAVIEIAGDAGALGRRLAGDWLQLDLAPDGTTLGALNGHGHVRLDLPQEGDTPARTIRADVVRGSGPPGQGVTAVNFQGGAGQVEYSETRPAPAAPRTARGKSLDQTMKPGFGEMEDAWFRGGAAFDEGDTKGTARDARYLVATGIVELQGDLGGRPPQVVVPQATIEARAIRVTLEGPKIAATGAIRSVLVPVQQPAGSPAGQQAAQAGKTSPSNAGGAKMPGILKQDEVTNATADEMQYDAGTGQATYKGKPARLWQVDTSVFGEQILLDQSNGDLHAIGSVISTMLLEQTDSQTKKTEKVRSVGRAQELLYEDALRRATYTGKADLTGPQGHLLSDRIVLYLVEGGGALERAEGYGHVTTTVQQPQKRTATGDEMKYFAADERYVMTGAPVTIVDECGESKGKTLTFFKSADRMIVDGNERTRTQTKGGAKCGEPRFD